jgi:hypothetical protein
MTIHEGLQTCLETVFWFESEYSAHPRDVRDIAERIADSTGLLDDFNSGTGSLQCIT